MYHTYTTPGGCDGEAIRDGTVQAQPEQCEVHRDQLHDPGVGVHALAGPGGGSTRTSMWTTRTAPEPGCARPSSGSMPGRGSQNVRSSARRSVRGSRSATISRHGWNSGAPRAACRWRRAACTVSVRTPRTTCSRISAACDWWTSRRATATAGGTNWTTPSAPCASTRSRSSRPCSPPPASPAGTARARSSQPTPA